jgi:hypothetical protein
MLTLRTLCDSADHTVARARDLLVEPSQRDASLAVLGAAALCAACAIGLAGSVIVGAAMQAPGGDSAPVVRRVL